MEACRSSRPKTCNVCVPRSTNGDDENIELMSCVCGTVCQLLVHVMGLRTLVAVAFCYFLTVLPEFIL